MITIDHTHTDPYELTIAQLKEEQRRLTGKLHRDQITGRESQRLTSIEIYIALLTAQKLAHPAPTP